jgi:tRNA (guanine-N7-)-methyltransferase
MTVRTFGRRRGRKLRPFKESLIETLLPSLSLRVENNQVVGDNFDSKQYKSCFFEIGFGAGEHLAKQAETHPETLMIGCEPFLNGVAHLLEQIHEKSLTNIRLYPGNALDLLTCLPEESLDRIFLLFPDPWPKKNHHKRRFVQKENLTLLSKKLTDTGKILMATDHDGYFDWMVEHAFTHKDLSSLNPDPETWTIQPEIWTTTRFQEKAIKAGRAPRFLWFGKKSF